jgi:hypothetical protein
VSLSGPRHRARGRPVAAFALKFAGGLAVLAAASVQADVITLSNGRVIEADRTWYEGSQLRYEKDGAAFGIPRRLVAHLEHGNPIPPNPDVQRAKQELTAGRPAEAVRLLTGAIARGDQSPEALYLLVEAHLASGDPVAARTAAEQGLKLQPQDARLHALRGDALLASGERLAAELAYRRSAQIHPDPEVTRKLDDLAPPPPAAVPPIGAQLCIRYDGSVNEPLGAQVLAALGDAYAEYERHFGSVLTQPVTVVLQTGTDFQADARNPEWAAGVNDGTIRAPVGGLERVTPGLLRVLRHELAHSFVTAATGGNCPTWLQEGIAEWLEGADAAHDDAIVVAALREQRVVSLLALDNGFRHLSAADATLAYAESHSAVAHILRTRGEPGLKRLLAALDDGLPIEEAFVVALADSYTEFHHGWTGQLLASAPH